MAAPQPVVDFPALRREITFNLATFRAKGRSPLPHELHLADRLRLPKRGFFRGLKQYTQRRPRAWAYDETVNPLGVGNRHNAPDAKLARIRLEGRLAPYGMNLVHTLGWGARGLVRAPGSERRPDPVLCC